MTFRNSKKYLTLREIQLAELEVLKEFDKVCKSNDLRYSLAYGTLLGAVRHKGFIPWDDDLDVAMPRPDYNKLLTLCDSFSNNIAFRSSYNSNLVTPFLKIVNTDIRMQETDYEGIEEEYLWIDVFPLDGINADSHEAERRINRINKLLKSCRHLDLNYPNDSLLKAILRKIYRSCIGNGRRFDCVKDAINDICCIDRYEDCDLIMPYLDELSFPLIYKKVEFEDSVNFEFEGLEFQVMSCWDYHLTSVYGDYMSMPSKNDRVNHGARAWRVI